VRHHPACPRTDAHVHPFHGAFIVDGELRPTAWVVCVDRHIIVTADEVLAERIAELINTHGLLDVPDAIPVEVMWGAPDPVDVIVDWRLPADPRQRGLET
jgi:hypothetical protein